MKATPKTVLALIHNAAHFIPADGNIYGTGAYAVRHLPATAMRAEQVWCDGPPPVGSTAKGFYRTIKSATHKSGWTPVDYVAGNIHD